jgi:anti-sigma B factor antagonist
MGARLQIDTVRAPVQGTDRCVLRVQGEIDLESSPTMWSRIQEHLAAESEVWVQLSGVEYMDSSGIAVLVQGHKHAGRSGRVFGLLDPSPKVRTLIELAQLHRLFRIEQTDDGSEST